MVEAVYVHWGHLTTLLRNAITITLSFGTNTTLLSDFRLDAKFKSPKHVVFSHAPVNCSGCETFRRSFKAMHNAFRSDFIRYPHEVEYLNEVRYMALYNHMLLHRLTKAVMLDSDVALLVPVSVAIDSKTYSHCDAVITYNQVSARAMPIHPTKLDAYWAGTGLLSLSVLRDYLQFVSIMYTDPSLRDVLIKKQRALPTINDMTSWCLFTIAQGEGHHPPVHIVDILRRSKAAPLMHRHRMCNTQPRSWSVEGGILHSASGEISNRMVYCDRDACRLNGAAYMQHYEKYWLDDVKHLTVARTVITNTTHRLYSLHSKELASPSVLRKLLRPAHRGLPSNKHVSD